MSDDNREPSELEKAARAIGIPDADVAALMKTLAADEPSPRSLPPDERDAVFRQWAAELRDAGVPESEIWRLVSVAGANMLSFTTELDEP